MQDHGLTEDETAVLAAAKKLKGKAKASSKQDLRRLQPLPLKTKLKAAPQKLTPEEQRQQQVLLECLEQAEKLPQQSSYAKHRKACILKALSLIAKSRCAWMMHHQAMVCLRLA